MIDKREVGKWGREGVSKTAYFLMTSFLNGLVLNYHMVKCFRLLF